MSSNSPERLPEETQSMYSETGDSESLINDFQVTLEELYPGLITEPEIFIENLEQEAIDSIHPAIREIMNRGWYPELAENLKNATVWGYLQDVVEELNSNFPIERLEVAREVLEELKELDEDSDIYDTADDLRVEEEIDRILRFLCPELMQKFEATEDSLEDVVGIFPENRIHMLFDSLKRRSEREKAYDEYCKLGYRKKGKILESLEIPWRSYRKLQQIYPELLEDPETWTPDRMSKLKEQYEYRGEDSGLIKNPELVKNLSELELFSLIYVLNLSVNRMNVGNAIGRMAGIVNILEDVRWFKVDRAKNFLMYEVKKRLDDSSNPLGNGFWGEVFVPWFCFYEKFFSWRLYKDDYKKGLTNALEVGLLMRAARDGHEEDIKGFLPNKEDWRGYELGKGDLERIRL